MHPSVNHPAPAREKVSGTGLLIPLVAAPLAWSIAELLDYGMTELSCDPSGPYALSVTHPHFWAGVASMLALALALAAAVWGFLLWRRTAGEHEGRGRHLVDIGEGRTRFLAMTALLTGAGFALVVLFTGAPLWFGIGCSR